MRTSKIQSVRRIGVLATMDIEVDSADHLFFANGIAASNSHAMAYSAVTSVELWLKHNYPVEFMAALLSNTESGKKKHTKRPVIVEYINYARRNGIDVLPPCVNKSGDGFLIEDRSIRFSLSHVKYVAKSAEEIKSHGKFQSMEHFFETVNKRRVNKKVVESLIAAGAFDCFGTKNEMWEQYHVLRAKGKKNKELPETPSPQKFRDWEVEVLGLCLSEEPIAKKYGAMARKNDWSTVDKSRRRGKLYVLGRIESIVPKVSKKGNEMLIVEISDGLDAADFFVFSDSMNAFKTEVRVGHVMAVPLKKFKDGDAMFLDSRREWTIVAK